MTAELEFQKSAETIATRNVRLSDGTQAQVLLQQSATLPVWQCIVFPDRCMKGRQWTNVELAAMCVEATTLFARELEKSA